MKYLLFILICACFIASDEPKKDSIEVKLKKYEKLEKIQIQQRIINEKLDSIWKKMEIDSTLRKK